jgi:hypothetical protein
MSAPADVIATDSRLTADGSRPDLRLPILAIAPNPWMGPWAGRQQLLSRLARRGWRVVYSTGANSVYDRHSRVWRDAPLRARFSTIDAVQVELPGKIPVRWPRFAIWDRLAIATHTRWLTGAARGPVEPLPILFLFHPKYAVYARALPRAHLVYHAFDTFSGLPGWTPDMAAGEREIVERARIVLASSHGIGKGLPGSGPSRYHLLENGADVDAFSRGSQEACPS